MPPKQQVNIRISDEARKLLKLLSYLLDVTEAQVIEGALTDAALSIITALTEEWLEDALPDVWEDYHQKVQLLIKAVERIKKIEIREADFDKNEEIEFTYYRPAGSDENWQRLRVSTTLENLYRSVGWSGAQPVNEEDE